MHLPIALVAALPSVLFLLLLPHRIWTLRKETVKTVPGHHRSYAKQFLVVLLAAVQITLGIEASSNHSRPSIAALSAALSFIASACLFPLLLLEHSRSIRPSDLAVIYLLASLVCDAAVLGKQVSKNAFVPLVVADFLPAAVSMSVKLCLLIVESRGKERILYASESKRSPEQLAGVLSRTFFWWINAILARGHSDILDEDSLPSLEHSLGSRLLRRRAMQSWDQRAKPETKLTLPRVLVASLLSPFLAPIVPRLCLIVFRYAQPVLISSAVRYLSTVSDESSPESSYSLIVTAVFVYVGLAISKARYQHHLNRLQTMIRGAVVGLINRKSLDQPSSDYSDAKVMTLMSTDANGVCQSARFFHETWAQLIEVVVGITMLGREVGWLCPVPLVIIFFCSRMSRYVAKNLQSKQRGWNEATQKRLAMTSSMLSSMNSLKMLGVTTYIESMVNSLRLQEIDMGSRVRWMMVAYNASANALGIFAPIITFVLFVLVARINGSTLDTEAAFTTTALLGLVTHPANMIMSIVPQAIGSMAAFERIQLYLLQPPRQDQRQDLKKVDGAATHASAAIAMDDVDIQPDPKAPPILTKVSLVVNRGSVVVCAGPMGSGKTTLAKAILGEIVPVRGSISVISKRIGYCEQSPWLPSGTLRSAICGYSPYEPSWYEQVVRLCCLEEDVATLSDGHETMIGSRGLNLSGGQRQRVALARAVYARCEIMILDDAFSALDGRTESRVVQNLLGPHGLSRTMGTTVFMISNSASHFDLADWLVLLGDNAIKYQGIVSDLPQSPEQILKVNTEATRDGGTENNIHVDKTLRSQELKVADAISDLSRATGDTSLYGYYIQAVGFRNFFILLACTSCYSFFITFPQYWLKKWTEAPPSQTTFYVGSYLIASLMAWVSTNGSMWSTHILIAPGSGAELHRRLLSTIVGASLAFFSTTDTGVILNRFSQDLELIDKQLPPAILSLSNQLFKLVVQVTLLFSAQKFMALTLPFCLAVVYLIQRVYLRTSRQLRLLDLESQSSVYSSFLESVEGITTIRAFSWKRQIEDANINCLDKSQQPAYTLLCLQQWLGLVLDLLVAAIATILIALALLLRGTTTAGQIGMALNLVLVANTTLLGLVTSWTNMEISLGAIARLKNLEATTPREDKSDESYVPVDTWPSSGTLECENVTVAYKPGTLALKNVTMKASAGQKIVVCGRTGSGKSTLLLSLLRLLETTSGTIKVDGVDLSLIPLSLLRERCFITITQDPFVFGQATLRFNLHPAASLPDEAIAAALQRVDLWTHFTSGRSSYMPSPEPLGVLNEEMAGLPPMSAGQLQLFCLARALLRLEVLDPPHSLSDAALSRPRLMPILLLDEATSSLDPDTEAVMQTVLHQNFTDRGHTVISITHRLSGVTENMRPDRDMVAVLSEGKVKMVRKAEDFIGAVSI